jgi:hypothetical protein
MTFRDFTGRVRPEVVAKRVFGMGGGREALARELERFGGRDPVGSKLVVAGRIVRYGENWEVVRQALGRALHVMLPEHKLAFERRLRSLRTASLTAAPVFRALAESAELNKQLSRIISNQPRAMDRSLNDLVPVKRSEFEGVWFQLSPHDRNAVVGAARRLLGGKFVSRAGEEE